MRTPRTGRVSKSGQSKITRALARGWRPWLGIGVGEIARRKRRARKGHP